MFKHIKLLRGSVSRSQGRKLRLFSLIRGNEVSLATQPRGVRAYCGPARRWGGLSAGGRMLDDMGVLERACYFWSAATDSLEARTFFACCDRPGTDGDDVWRALC